MSSRPVVVVLALSLVLFSCSRRAAPPIERVAVLPFENLTAETSLDWAGAAASAILAYDLMGSKTIHPIEASSIRDARLGAADRYVEGYFTTTRGSLEFHATIDDPVRRAMERTVVLKATPDRVIDAINDLAKSLSSESRYFPPCKADAIRLYSDAMQNRGTFDAAVKADPNCTPLYLPWAESLTRRGDRGGAAQVCAAALKLPGLDPIGRGQLQYVAATAEGNVSAQLQALRSLLPMLPADLELRRTIARTEFANRDFADAVRSLEALTRAEPSAAQMWNTLGYARAGAHDLKGARDALERYQGLLAPGQTNGIDSEGEVSFFLGDFAAAERYFLDAQQKNPKEFGGRELLKAAEARMMTGDLAGADKILSGLPNLSALERAQWEFLTGRRKQAMARLATPKDTREALQLGIWKAQLKQGPLPQSGAEPFGRAITLLLAGRFADAVPLLEPLYRGTSPGADGQIRALLAWAYAGSGRRDEAAKLLDRYPIPLASEGEPLIASLVFPRFVQLRGEILNSERDRQLAAKYAGD